MKNLEKFGVQKLDSKEANKINGGVIGIILGAFFLGRRVEYVKDGGGVFDFYL